MMNRNPESAQSAVRTRRLMLKPNQPGDEEIGTNVLPVGTHLGEFEIKGLIGEGGFGIVYLAYDHSLERQVALKEYMPSGLATRTTNMAVSVRSQKKLDTFTAGLKSFINEARMLAQFDSPALVKVHSFWEGNGTAYMVMPYYEGITLKQALQAHRVKPTEGWIRMLLADLCEAIDILHRSHCLHRDIAPDNILLLKDGRPLLLDFGAARRVIGDLTQCFTAILKPGFAPIEQYADIAGLRQGAWTDIYALAAVVYYLITGKAPPPSVARMVHDELVPAREAGKGRYSEAFLATVDKALSVRPEHRFHSIDELRHALNIMEPEPRTVPYPGAEWATTVARTAPLAPPPDGNIPGGDAGFGAPGKPPARGEDPGNLTRHLQPSATGMDDLTAIAPSARPMARQSAQHAGAYSRNQTGFAAPPPQRQPARQAATRQKTASAGYEGAREPYLGPLPGRTYGHEPENSPEPQPPLSSGQYSAATASADQDLLSATRMAGDWRGARNPSMPPPHQHSGDAAMPGKRDKQGWLILALLFAAGIGSGIYLGTNHSWDGLSQYAIESGPQASGAEGSDRPGTATPRAETSAKVPPQPADQSVAAAAPPASSSRNAASSGSSESPSASGSPGAAGAQDDSEASLGRLRSEIESWKSASKNNGISGYERYLHEYPQGLYAPIAKLRLERLHAAAAPAPARPESKAENKVENKAESKAAVVAKTEPAAPPVSRIRPEEAAWDKATTANSTASYQEYLRKYPRGGYAALARDRLASMKLAANRTTPLVLQPEVRLPAAPPSGAGTASSGSTRTSTPAPPAAPPSTAAAPAVAASPSTATRPSTSVNATVPAAPAPVEAITGKQKEPGSQSQIAAVAPSSAADPSGTARAVPPAPPQASIRTRDSESQDEAGTAAAGHAIRVADQTMTGDFTVDKKTGLVSGKGKISWSNGNHFEGTLVQGSKEGKGKFAWTSGQRYSGDWLHDAPNGKGSFVFPDGSRYEGEVREGFPHGEGTMRFRNGVVYTGDWLRGKLHGHGRYTWNDGSYWDGEFKNDQKTENGKMYYPNKAAAGTGTAAPSPAGSAAQRSAAIAPAREQQGK